MACERYGDPPRQIPAARRATLCYGCRSAAYLAGVEDFQRAGVDVRLSTDDGSAGQRGLVTDLVRPLVEQSALPCRIVCLRSGGDAGGDGKTGRAIGAALPGVAGDARWPAGMGICFSCVAKVRDGAGHWDYRRTCVEGPVFDARDVKFGC